jgi:hypothetical protein
MNLVQTTCKKCNRSITINAAEENICMACEGLAMINHYWSTPRTADTVPMQPNQCTDALSLIDSDDEFDPLTEEEIDMTNDFDETTLDPDAEFEPLTTEELELTNDFTDQWPWEEEPLHYEDLPGLTGPNCVCGAVKAGTPWHSDWCDITKASKD